MSEMILGLDIGDDSVKALLAIPERRREVHILAFETVLLEDGVDLEAAIKKIAEKIRPLVSQGLRSVVSLPPSDFLFRQISLPFHDENKIKKTLPFELESLLPLPIGEVVFDYLHLPNDRLMVGACRKDRISNVLSVVEEHIGKVSAIDIATASLALPLLEQKALSGRGILLDIGASTTGAAFYENNILVQIRSFSFGGNTITNALAGEPSCGVDKARQIKETGAARDACRQFCVLLANTIEFMRLSNILHGAPAAIKLTFGGSLFQPLVEELENTFGPTVELIDISRCGQTRIDEKLSGDCLPQIMNTALANVQRVFAAHKSFNFRQGNFVPQNVFVKMRKQWARWAIVAGIIMLLFVVDQTLDYRLQAREASALKNSISALFKKHYPQASMVDPVAQLQTKLTADRKMYGFDDGALPVSVLAMLKEISCFISPSLDIVVTHYHYENNIVLLKGAAKKIDDVTSVKNELLKSKYFKNVAIGSTSLAREGSQVDFDLRIELR
jgi:general secretion pathway protein L